MHPVITAWLAMVTVLDQMPKWTDPAYGPWLEEAEALSEWFNTLRRLAL